MAFKFTVDYSNLRVIIDTDSVQPVSVFQNLKSLVTFTNLQSSLQYVNLSAVNVFLDADSKNLYFLPGHPNAESFSLTDLPVLTFSTTKEETVSIAEELALAFATSQSDTVGIAESLSKVVDFVRAFSETSTLVDAPAIAFSTAFDDSSTLSESAALGIEPVKSDNLSFLDSEVLSVDPSKSDAVSVSDAPVLDVDLPQSDTANIAESNVLGVDKAIPESDTVIYTVTVAPGTNSYGSGNKYYIDGVVSPALTLDIGKTYRFDVSDSSVSGHPFRFSETANGSHSGGSVYSTNVTVNGTAGSSGAYVEIEITASTPVSLHYYCTNHSGMGGTITTQVAESVVISEVFSRVATFTRTFSDSYALDDTASPSDELRTDVNINKGNIVGIGDSAPVFTFSTSFADTSTITDSPSIEFITTFADSVTLSELLISGAGSIYTDTTSISETLAHSFGKSLSDSATITESINVVLVSGSSSVLNTSAFNTSVLN